MNNFFQISARGSTVFREMFAGIVTFAAMAYILCVQPAVMSGKMFGIETGLDAAALITTTCLVSAFACILMGLWANYPIALAPGMGENIFVVLTVIPACAAVKGDWHLALGIVFISGVSFAIISLFGVRKYLLSAITPSMRAGIAGGIGLFIALLGLQGGEIIVCKNNYYVLNSLTATPAPLVFFIGLITAAVLQVRNIRGSLFFGIIASALAAAMFQMIHPVQFFGLPADPMPVVGKMDIAGVFVNLHVLLPLILILTFMDLFDTFGTVAAIGTQAGLIKEGDNGSEFPNVERVFMSDAVATVAGSIGGHSTVTSFIESAAGVESGGRTGLTAITTGVCFLAAMFFSPFILTVAGYQPITAAALVAVGALMMRNIALIQWDDFSESFPAFLFLIGIPFSYSIAGGLIIGLILYPLLKLLSGKAKEVSITLYILAAMLILYVVFVR
jgi:AGZA family xanthine/uracil permease-like MFS transporter